MANESQPETTETSESEEYAVKYEVHFHNCTINNVNIQQTGKPGTQDPPPGTGGGGGGS